MTTGNNSVLGLHVGLLKPITIAVSSSLLFACGSVPQGQAPSTKATTPTVSTPTATNVPAVQTPTAIEVSGYQATNNYAGVLDQATLDELEDLLQATDMTMVEGDELTVIRYGDLWDRVRRGYRMQQVQNSRIEAQKSWFYNRQNYIDRLVARTSRYLHYTVTEAERRGLPTELALLPIIESSYDPSATSNAAAAGLWQFIPSTGRIYGLNQSSSYDGRRDVIESTRAAYDFLTSLYNQFGSWELALAAYNAGPGRVQKAINANRGVGLPTDYWSLRLPQETMNYVPRFMAVAQIIGNPSSYGVYIPPIANHNHFRAVPTNYGVSLYEVANVTGVPVDELRLLNPALINLSVDASGAGRVLIPDSVPANADNQLRALVGRGYGATTTAKYDYVVLNADSYKNPQSAQTLASANALPTTTASLTPNNTIIQEPVLTQEEKDFIAAQIRANSVDDVQPIASDGRIDLNSVQTAQSVLEARGQTKSLEFNAPSATPNTTSSQPVANVQRYKVVAGDTLTGIATRHGLSVSQLASYNGISTNTKVRTGDRLWLIPGKVSTVADKVNQPTSASAKTTTYTVRSGDSLTALARRHNISLADLAAMNGLSTNDDLLIGQKLTVPAGKTTATTASTTTTDSKKAGKTAKYIIQSGDTLTSVANKYGVSINELAVANNLSRDAKLIRGKTLTIPAAGTVDVKKAKQVATKQARAEAKKANQVAKGKVIRNTESYTVKAGDSLNGLAGKYGVSANNLAATNNLPANAQLQRGQTIKVPKLTDTYTVKSGDSLNSLAKKYGISVAELAKMNNLSSKAKLQKGQKLTVPVR